MVIAPPSLPGGSLFTVLGALRACRDVPLVVLLLCNATFGQQAQ
jgi:hypothetical protein